MYATKLPSRSGRTRPSNAGVVERESATSIVVGNIVDTQQRKELIIDKFLKHVLFFVSISPAVGSFVLLFLFSCFPPL